MTIFDDVPLSGVSEGMVSEFRFEYYTNFHFEKYYEKKLKHCFSPEIWWVHQQGTLEAGVNSIFP